jgi:hypothetical protein
MAYDVMMRPDIDIAVTCEVPDIAASFAVMFEVAQVPGVRRIRFASALNEPDKRLYWQIRYRDSEPTLTSFHIRNLRHETEKRGKGPRRRTWRGRIS